MMTRNQKIGLLIVDLEAQYKYTIDHIKNMINDYNNDNELELLTEPLLDWIGEYLYDLVY